MQQSKLSILDLFEFHRKASRFSQPLNTKQQYPSSCTIPRPASKNYDVMTHTRYHARRHNRIKPMRGMLHLDIAQDMYESCGFEWLGSPNELSVHYSQSSFILFSMPSNGWNCWLHALILMATPDDYKTIVEKGLIDKCSFVHAYIQKHYAGLQYLFGAGLLMPYNSYCSGDYTQDELNKILERETPGLFGMDGHAYLKCSKGIDIRKQLTVSAKVLAQMIKDFPDYIGAKKYLLLGDDYIPLKAYRNYVQTWPERHSLMQIPASITPPRITLNPAQPLVVRPNPNPFVNNAYPSLAIDGGVLRFYPSNAGFCLAECTQMYMLLTTYPGSGIFFGLLEHISSSHQAYTLLDLDDNDIFFEVNPTPQVQAANLALYDRIVQRNDVSFRRHYNSRTLLHQSLATAHEVLSDLGIPFVNIADYNGTYNAIVVYQTGPTVFHCHLEMPILHELYYIERGPSAMTMPTMWCADDALTYDKAGVTKYPGLRNAIAGIRQLAYRVAGDSTMVTIEEIIYFITTHYNQTNNRNTSMVIEMQGEIVYANVPYAAGIKIDIYLKNNNGTHWERYIANSVPKSKKIMKDPDSLSVHSHDTVFDRPVMTVNLPRTLEDLAKVPLPDDDDDFSISTTVKTPVLKPEPSFDSVKYVRGGDGINRADKYYWFIDVPHHPGTYPFVLPSSEGGKVCHAEYYIENKIAKIRIHHPEGSYVQSHLGFVYATDRAGQADTTVNMLRIGDAVWKRTMQKGLPTTTQSTWVFAKQVINGHTRPVIETLNIKARSILRYAFLSHADRLSDYSKDSTKSVLDCQAFMKAVLKDDYDTGTLECATRLNKEVELLKDKITPEANKKVQHRSWYQRIIDVIPKEKVEYERARKRLQQIAPDYVSQLDAKYYFKRTTRAITYNMVKCSLLFGVSRTIYTQANKFCNKNLLSKIPFSPFTTPHHVSTIIKEQIFIPNRWSLKEIFYPCFNKPQNFKELLLKLSPIHRLQYVFSRLFGGEFITTEYMKYTHTEHRIKPFLKYGIAAFTTCLCTYGLYKFTTKLPSIISNKYVDYLFSRPLKWVHDILLKRASHYKQLRLQYGCLYCKGKTDSCWICDNAERTRVGKVGWIASDVGQELTAAKQCYPMHIDHRIKKDDLKKMTNYKKVITPDVPLIQIIEEAAERPIKETKVFKASITPNYLHDIKFNTVAPSTYAALLAMVTRQGTYPTQPDSEYLDKIGFLDIDIKFILQAIMTMKIPTEEEFLKTVHNSKRELYKRSLQAFHRCPKIRNTYDVFVKPGETGPNDVTKRKARVICNPDKSIVGPGTYANHLEMLVRKRYWLLRLEHDRLFAGWPKARRLIPFIHAMNAGSVRDQIEQVANTFKDPVLITLDIANYDASQSRKLFDLDFKIRRCLRILYALAGWNEKEIDEFMRFANSADADLRLYDKDNIHQPKVKRLSERILLAIFKAKQTTFSGDPLKTTLGNTERQLAIAFSIFKTAGIIDDVYAMASGDDMLILVERAVLNKALEALYAGYAKPGTTGTHGNGMILKEIMVNDNKGVFLSKTVILERIDGYIKVHYYREIERLIRTAEISVKATRENIPEDEFNYMITAQIEAQVKGDPVLAKVVHWRKKRLSHKKITKKNKTNFYKDPEALFKKETHTITHSNNAICAYYDEKYALLECAASPVDVLIRW